MDVTKENYSVRIYCIYKNDENNNYKGTPSNTTANYSTLHFFFHERDRIRLCITISLYLNREIKMSVQLNLQDTNVYNEFSHLV
jgi:hypothetical protein